MNTAESRIAAWLADTSAGDAITAAEEELATAFGDRLATLCASLDAPTPAEPALDSPAGGPR